MLLKFFYYSTILASVISEESQTVVNGITPVNIVDKEFISTSVDPAIFFSDVDVRWNILTFLFTFYVI